MILQHMALYGRSLEAKKKGPKITRKTCLMFGEGLSLLETPVSVVGPAQALMDP